MPDGPGGFPRDFSCPAVLRNLPTEPDGCRLQDCHLLWSPVPESSTINPVCDSAAFRPDRPYNPREHAPWFGLVRVRSPLLTESRLLSSPAGTEMVHFPAFASMELCNHSRITGHDSSGVTPFGNPRIKACLRLPEAYRSLPRPSSTVSAKAFTVRP